MSDNSNLNKTKYSSENTDEWYTTYKSIKEEVEHYKEQFYGKVVLCNCDNPFESNFCFYFLYNFDRLHLKKLICTSYNTSNERGFILSVDKVLNGIKDCCSPLDVSNFIKQSAIVKQLNGNGDFRSDECVKYLKECDVCCTNPPFSLFRELFSLLVSNNKQYLLVGTQNVLTYKEIFKYIKENKAWTGYLFGDMSFRVPNTTKPRATRYWVDASGQKWRSLGNVVWLTNMDTLKRHEKLNLTQKYELNKYSKFDDFDAINVSKLVDIPYDYDGIMGVPITYLKYHNAEQFEIVGEAKHGSDSVYDLFKPKINGKEVFTRILIKKK